MRENVIGNPCDTAPGQCLLHAKLICCQNYHQIKSLTASNRKSDDSHFGYLVAMNVGANGLNRKGVDFTEVWPMPIDTKGEIVLLFGQVCSLKTG